MADAPALLDRFGKPFPRTGARALAEPIATASLTGVRQAWTAQTVASGLTPQRLARIMRQAAEGDHLEFVILAEEMEERDWHYAAALSQRKLAVLGLERTVTAAPNDPQGEEIAAAVREDLIDDEALEDLLTGCLDAMGKGWAAVEIAWATDGTRWKPATTPDLAAYGRTAGATEAVLDANPQLVGLGPVLAAGLTLTLPDLPAPPPTPRIKLWD